MERVRPTTRGSIGTQMFQFKGQRDALAGMVSVNPNQQAYLLTNENRVLRFAINEVRLQDQDAMGDRLFELNSGEKIIGVRSGVFLQ
jgi:DNA gyrase subunit A